MNNTAQIARYIAISILTLGVIGMAHADVVIKKVSYQYGKKEFNASLVYNDAIKAKRPGIMVLHEWWGITPELMDKARRLANEGYVAFVADLYGDARVTEHPEEAGKMMAELTTSKEVWRGRAQAALTSFQALAQVDPKKIAAIGFCLGGNTAINMVYANFDIVAGVAYHSTLALPDASDTLTSKAKLLVLHGAQDPLVPAGGIENFTTTLGQTALDWQLNLYPAKHAFTNPKANTHNNPALAYNPQVYERSWRAMHLLLSSLFN